MKRLFIFGLGYSAKRIAGALKDRGWQVDATGNDGNIDFDNRSAVEARLNSASHVLCSVPPDRESGSDPVLEKYGDLLHGKWIAYLSSTGVYGDTGGAWVDESAPVGRGRRLARSEADATWLELGARVLRLPGIYGPGRSALDRVRDGKARRIDLPGQVFSRVHVDDIAAGAVSAIEGNAPAGPFNLADDEPASQNALVEESCRLLGLPLPPLQSVGDAGLTEMARGFYSENRRVANGKAKRILGWAPRYPTFREGLASLL